jgi:tRNA pseudouridine32 synthase/23S rRNA pseudouridine746 synthase
MSLPTLPVMIEDRDFIVVHKPENMLSVPGKVSLPPRQYPRHIEWLNSMKETYINYKDTESEYSADIKKALEQLTAKTSFPRKEKPFKQQVRMSLKVDNPLVLDAIWKLVVAQDVQMHKKPLDQIPSDLISAAEIVEALFGKIYHVHRLDMSTSGILLFARGEESCNLLSKQFRDRVVSKVYIAEVLGKLEEKEFEISVPIRGDFDNRPRQIVDLELGKPSVTKVRVLEYRTRLSKNDGSLQEISTTVVELVPLTGRTHQLRLHMSHIGFPILGDDLYSSQLAQEIADNRLHLHAHKLVFFHPYLEREYSITAKCSFYDTICEEDQVIVSNKRKIVAVDEDQDADTDSLC